MLDPLAAEQCSAQVVYPDAKRKEVVELLEQHITDNIVKVCRVAVVDLYRVAVVTPTHC